MRKTTTSTIMKRLCFPTPGNLPSTSILLLASSIASFLLVNFATKVIPWTNPSHFVTFLILFSFVTISKLFYQIILYPHFFSPLRHLPSPSGSSWWMGQYKRILAEPSGHPQTEWFENIPNNGLIRYTTVLNAERLAPTTPEVLRELLQSKSYIFQKPKMMQNGVGNVLGRTGLLFAEGDVHRMKRRHISPAFAVKQLQGMVPTFLKKSEELIDCVERAIESVDTSYSSGEGFKGDGNAWTVIDMMPWMSKVALDIIGSAGFGYDFESLRDDNNEINIAYRNIFSSSFSNVDQILGALSPWLSRILRRQRHKILKDSVATIATLCKTMIREKKRELEVGGKVGEKDILSIITKDSPFSEEEMKDQLMTFMAAGQETTSNTLAWALYLLVLHPEIQSKLHQEIRSSYPTLSSLTSTTYEKLDTLPLLRCVLLEIFRFYPTVAVTLRQATEDTTLGGEFVPKGTMVIVVPWALNRSKKLWGPTADKFDPSRWERSNSKSNSVEDDEKNFANYYRFMTFLHGPRSCIGKDFARLEIKSILAALLGRFEFRPPKPGSMMNVTMKGGIALKPGEGMRLGIRRVSGW